MQAGVCVCVCFGCACDIFPSVSIPFAGQQTCVTSLSCLFVLPQVRSASLLPRGSGGSGLLKHTCHEFTSQLLRRESNKMHVFGKPDLKRIVQLPTGNFISGGCIFRIEIRLADPREGIFKGQEVNDLTRSGYCTWSAIAT